MKFSRVLIGIGCAALLGVAFAQSIKQISVALADKTLKLNSIVVKGETYVSLKQLKAAFPVVAGGANPSYPTMTSRTLVASSTVLHIGPTTSF